MPEHTPAPTPARSLYGFFMYLFFKTLIILYCAWACLPGEYLNYFGIYYYPLKYWSTAVPIQCLVALTLFAFIIYPSTNLMLSTNIDSINTITDSNALYSSSYKYFYNYNSDVKCICKGNTGCFKEHYISPPKDMDRNTVLPLQDLDISVVCKKLYLKK